MNFSVVIPAFNEEGSVRKTVDDIVAEHPQADVIVVDDGSTDGTAQALAGSKARCIAHRRNRGYGASLKTGVLSAKKDIVVFCDADGQHRASDIARLLGEMKDADMVIGQRTQLLHSTLWRMPGKWLLGWLANFLARTKIPDLNSGLRALRRDVALEFIGICPNGFSMSSTLTIAALAEGMEVKWIPVEINPRAEQSVSTVKLKTGFDTILLILRLTTLFEPLRVFLPVATLFVVAGIFWGIPYAIESRGVSIGALLLIVTGVITFFFGMIADQNVMLRNRRR